jgi:hypothetical protein
MSTYSVCDNEKVIHLQNLKTFPFKNRAKCFSLSFEASEFGDEYYKLIHEYSGEPPENLVNPIFKKYRVKHQGERE